MGQETSLQQQGQATQTSKAEMIDWVRDAINLFFTRLDRIVDALERIAEASEVDVGTSQRQTQDQNQESESRQVTSGSRSQEGQADPG
jgi:hypothetical protein